MGRRLRSCQEVTCGIDVDEVRGRRLGRRQGKRGVWDEVQDDVWDDFGGDVGDDVVSDVLTGARATLEPRSETTSGEYFRENVWATSITKDQI